MMNLWTSTGLPWLDSPVMLHSSRKDKCTLTPEQCEYRSGYWRYWYQSDHVYGHNTIYFLCAVTGVFALAHLWNRASSRGRPVRSARNPVVATLRYLSYRTFYVRALGWHSPVLGVMLLGLVGFVYFMGESGSSAISVISMLLCFESLNLSMFASLLSFDSLSFDLLSL